MTDTWAQDLQRVLVAAGRHVVRDLPASHDRPLDAFCVVVDSGSCWIAWDLAPRRWLPGALVPPRDSRTPGDFTEPNADLPADLVASLVDVGDTYAARYDAAEQAGRGDHAEEQLDAGIETAAAAALIALEPDLHTVPRTEGFVAYVIRFDGRWLEESVRRTVPDVLVARRFPGFDTAHDLAVELGALSSAHGPRALVARLVDAYAVPPTDRLDLDLIAVVERELHGNGQSAIDPVLDALEAHARQPQFTTPGSVQHRHLGAWTRAHRLTAHVLLQVLPRLAGVHQDGVERRLVELGRWLHEHREWLDDREHLVVGLNESLVARTLHTLWPDRHPQVDVSHVTNEVRNASDYGFTTSEQI